MRASASTRGLGFERQALIPQAAFVSAGGYHHHLGLNTWQSAGGPPPPCDAPGLRLVAFELGSGRGGRRRGRGGRRGVGGGRDPG